MADEQARIAAGLRDLAERVERLLPVDEAGVALGTATAIAELREILDSLALLRTGLVMQERTLEAALDREAKRGGRG